MLLASFSNCIGSSTLPILIFYTLFYSFHPVFTVKTTKNCENWVKQLFCHLLFTILFFHTHTSCIGQYGYRSKNVPVNGLKIVAIRCKQTKKFFRVFRREKYRIRLIQTRGSRICYYFFDPTNGCWENNEIKDCKNSNRLLPQCP